MVESVETIWVLVIAVLISALIVAIIFWQQKTQALKRQYHGVKLLSMLKELLASVQAHRGRTTAYLNKDFSVKLEISTLQRKIIQLINDIARSAPELEFDEGWQNITQHWTRLSVSYTRNLPANNLTQHNQLVQSILFLMDETVDNSGFFTFKNKNLKALRFLWQELLTAAEYIGQARAVGSGVIAASYCSERDRQQLAFLQQKIKETTSLAWRSLPANEFQQQQLLALQRFIGNDLVAVSDKNSVSTEEYFRLCTELMDSLYQQYDETIKQFE